MITLKTNYGDITLQLDEKAAPKTAANFLKHVQEGYYNGTLFHRVIDGFMIQTGGFATDMQSKEKTASIENEADTAASNTRGSVAMARTNDPHSASTQFFINVADNDFLNHKAKNPQGWGYCVFAHVTEGMDVVDKISKVATTSKAGHQDVPEADIIISEAVVTE